MTQPRLLVLKLGGSLLDWPELPSRLNHLIETQRTERPDQRMILIGGGGSVAEFVRTVHRLHGLDDRASHDLAVRAMDFTAWILAALLPAAIIPVRRIEDLSAAWTAGMVPVLVPRPILDQIERTGADPLPLTWDVTSDSIAAWFSVHAKADRLILIKSAALPPGTSREEAVRLGWVDKMFPHLARGLPSVQYLNLRDPAARPQDFSPRRGTDQETHRPTPAVAIHQGSGSIEPRP